MQKILTATRYRFVATVILTISAVLVLVWGMLSWYSAHELDRPAHISEVHKTSASNEAFADYLQEQQEYEAHFITLASDIKQQEADRVDRALGMVTAIVAILGVAIAIFVSRVLMKPVQEAYDSQERFMQDAAHELRNPLAAMTAALQQADSKTQQTNLYKTFHRQTKRLIHINEDLLFLERQHNDQPEKLNISELLNDVIEELQPLASSRGIRLQVSQDTNIHKTISASDYVRLVKNIIDNAIKYSKNNSTVSISQTKRKGSIVIEVADKGIGIPKKDQPNIGNRFYRASNTGATDGTGLGLAIVQKILNMYGGQIQLQSAPKKGTTVTITLPA